MDIDREDGRTANQLRSLACSRNFLTGLIVLLVGIKSAFPLLFAGVRVSGLSLFMIVWNAKVLAAVYGPKAGTDKNENPEKACVAVIWKLNPGRLVVHDDGALLPCAINAACAALVGAGIPMKQLAVDDYFLCIQRRRAASASLSAFLRKSLQQSQRDSSKAG